MKTLVSLACLLSLLFLSACSAGFYELAKYRTERDADLLVSVICVDGSGPPLTGQGKIRAVFVKEGFQGVVMLKENCEIAIDHYLPFKEETEKFKAERRKSALPGV